MKEYFLEDLLLIKNGRDHKHLPDGEIPIYGSGGIMRYGNQSIYNEESILLPRKGTLSNIQYVDKPFWTVDTIYYTIVNQDKANPLYLFHYLKQLDLSYLNSGTGVPSMTFGAYYGVKVKLPELEIQQKIAKVLSDLDAKIEINNKINAELEAMAKTLYDYWFVQFDFPDANGKPYKSSGGKMVWNEELKREIPEGWEVDNLLSVSNITTGKLDSNAEVENGEYHFFTCSSTPTKTDSYAFDDSVILIAGNNANGNFHINRFTGKFNAYQRTYIITANERQFLDYLYQVLSRQMKVLKTRGNGSQTKFLTIGMLNSIPVFKPSLDLMLEFSIKTISMNEKQVNLMKENQQLASLRDWLLPMLMNGQVRVGDVEEELGMVAEGFEGYKSD